MVFGGNIALTFGEAKIAMHQQDGWKSMMLRRVASYLLDIPGRWRGARDRRACLGGALIARLRSSLAKREIPLWLDTGLTDLVFEGNKVTGARARKAGRPIHIAARRGVILAAGGFEHDQELRERFLPGPTDTAWSTANPANTGDVLRAGLRHGLATDYLDEAWWGPTNPVPGRGSDIAFMFVTERCAPGSLIVNRAGVRVVNEAAPYPDIVRAMHAGDGETSVPLIMIVDRAFRQRSALGPLMPGSDRKPIPSHLSDNHFITEAESLAELACKLGIHESTLSDTVQRFNGFAETGKDLDFGRGDKAYDHYWADSKHGPNPCLGPLRSPPFYAVELYPGDIGTRGGLRVDEFARVLYPDGEPTRGLYAVGNCSAPVFGAGYPGAGATLGPAMTFGYVAAKHAAGPA